MNYNFLIGKCQCKKAKKLFHKINLGANTTGKVVKKMFFYGCLVFIHKKFT